MKPKADLRLNKISNVVCKIKNIEAIKEDFRISLVFVRHDQILGEGLDLLDSSHFSFKQGQLKNVEILVEVRDLIQILGLNFDPKNIRRQFDVK